MKLGVPGFLIKGLIIVIEKGDKEEDPGTNSPSSFFLDVENLFVEWNRGGRGQLVKSRSGLGLGEVLDVSPCCLPHRESRSEKLEGKFDWS